MNEKQKTLEKSDNKVSIAHERGSVNNKTQRLGHLVKCPGEK